MSPRSSRAAQGLGRRAATSRPRRERPAGCRQGRHGIGRPRRSTGVRSGSWVALGCRAALVQFTVLQPLAPEIAQPPVAFEFGLRVVYACEQVMVGGTD